MAVVHTTEPVVHEHSGNGMGFLMGVILLLIVGFLLFFYGLPLLRNTTTNTAPQVSVPEKVDINVNQK